MHDHLQNNRKQFLHKIVGKTVYKSNWTKFSCQLAEEQLRTEGGFQVGMCVWSMSKSFTQ